MVVVFSGRRPLSCRRKDHAESLWSCEDATEPEEEKELATIRHYPSYIRPASVCGFFPAIPGQRRLSQSNWRHHPNLHSVIG